MAWLFFHRIHMSKLNFFFIIILYEFQPGRHTEGQAKKKKKERVSENLCSISSGSRLRNWFMYADRFSTLEKLHRSILHSLKVYESVK